MGTHLVMRRFFGWGAAVALAVAAPAATAKDYGKKDIVDTAAAAGSFSTLLAAADAAGLVETLKGEGPYTVFAPTDDAFAKLPEGAVKALLEDKEKLAAILLYHVVPGKMDAGAVTGAKSLDTAFGQPLMVSAGEGVTVGGAAVVKTDIAASNGIIHVIDSVMMPPTLVEVAAGNDDFSTLVAAVKAADLVEILSAGGPFTVFAPTNAAFAALPEGTVASLLEPENKAKLQAVLTYHVVPGIAKAADVVTMKSATSVQGDSIDISVKDEQVYVDGAKVIATDIAALNGVIHVIDAVILPGE
jgi:transforming growth factor-beta-induced protein